MSPVTSSWMFSLCVTMGSKNSGVANEILYNCDIGSVQAFSKVKITQIFRLRGSGASRGKF